MGGQAVCFPSSATVNLAVHPECHGLCDEQRIEPARRLAAYQANPNQPIPWDEVTANLQEKFRKLKT